MDLTATDQHVWDIICETVQYSKLTREQFKKATLAKGNISQNEKPTQTKFHERRIRSFNKDIEKIEELLVGLQLAKELKKEKAFFINRKLKVFNAELVKIQAQIDKSQAELIGLIQQDTKIDWYDDH
jgi:hypothetical protein